MENSHTELHGNAFGLMMGCPFTMDNSDKTCPLYKLREEYADVEAKLEYIENLSEDELLKLIDTHKECVDRKI